jgi:predicted RNA binding protein YcfA (HicA-like mRNA interferase family)
VPLRPLPYREVKRKLEAAGFTQVSQKGSHVKFIRRTDEGTRTAIVPRHREVVVGTLRSIVRQAGLASDEFERL